MAGELLKPQNPKTPNLIEHNNKEYIVCHIAMLNTSLNMDSSISFLIGLPRTSITPYF